MLFKRRTQKALATEDRAINSLLRDLYTRLLMQTGAASHPILGVSSAIDGEGKTTIASKLAITLGTDGTLSEPGARAGDILLVECNQASSTISEGFGISAQPGLIHYLQHRCALEDAVRQTAFGRLWLMPSGGLAPDFPILIRTPIMRETVQGLRERFDWIIFDLPSVLTSTDLQVLAELTDRILLVVRSGVTPSKLISQALDQIGRERLAGIVLNDMRPDLPGWLEQRF